MIVNPFTHPGAAFQSGFEAGDNRRSLVRKPSKHESGDGRIEYWLSLCDRRLLPDCTASMEDFNKRRRTLV